MEQKQEQEQKEKFALCMQKDKEFTIKKYFDYMQAFFYLQEKTEKIGNKNIYATRSVIVIGNITITPQNMHELVHLSQKEIDFALSYLKKERSKKSRKE